MGQAYFPGQVLTKLPLLSFDKLQKGGFKDNNVGRLNHDSMIGKTPLSTVETQLGAKFSLHWPSLDE
jgi:hypothetical protein